MHSMNLSPIPRHDSKPKFTLCWACKGCELRPPMWVYKNGCVAKLKKVKHIEPKKNASSWENFSKFVYHTWRPPLGAPFSIWTSHIPSQKVCKALAETLQKPCRNPNFVAETQAKSAETMQKPCRKCAETLVSAKNRGVSANFSKSPFGLGEKSGPMGLLPCYGAWVLQLETLRSSIGVVWQKL